MEQQTKKQNRFPFLPALIFAVNISGSSGIKTTSSIFGNKLNVTYGNFSTIKVADKSYLRGNVNITNKNLTTVNCIKFSNGASWCSA